MHMSQLLDWTLKSVSAKKKQTQRAKEDFPEEGHPTKASEAIDTLICGSLERC